MIQWTIPHAVEGATSRSYSSKQTFETSFSSSFSSSSTEGGTGTNPKASGTTIYNTFSVSSYTVEATASTHTNGQWSYYTQSAMRYTASSTSGWTYNNPNNTHLPSPIQSYSESSSESSSESASDVTTFMPPTFLGGTSAVESSETTRTTTTQQVVETTAWTTSSVDSRIAFVTTAASVSNTVTTDASFASIYTTVTEGGEICFLDYEAQVVQADSSEVIYRIEEPATAWMGFAPAIDAAQSATRVTIFPKYSTKQMLAVASSAPVSTLTVSAVTTSITFGRTTSAATTVTAVNYFVFPNTTTTQASSALTTSTTFLSSTLFYSAQLVYGYGIGQQFGQSAAVTTVTIASHANNVTTCQSFIGSFSVVTTCGTTVSATRTTTEMAMRQADTGKTTIAQNFLSNTSASTWSEDGIIQVIGPALITVSHGGITQKKFYSTTGVVMDEAAAHWFTAAGSGTLLFADGYLYATAGQSVPAKTLLPQTNNSRTVSENSIFYTTTTSTGTISDKTTLSLVAGVDGLAQTKAADRRKTMRLLGASTFYSPNANGLGHFGGGPLGAGQTVVQEVLQAGAFKDRIDGTPTSFNVGATSYGEAWSAPVRKWDAVACIGPVQNRLNRGPVWWTERRNIVDNAVYFTSLTA